jgi:hypothetical protein
VEELTGSQKIFPKAYHYLFFLCFQLYKWIVSDETAPGNEKPSLKAGQIKMLLCNELLIPFDVRDEGSF